MTKEKKNTEIATTSAETTEMVTIPSKQELQIGVRKTLEELDKKLSTLTTPGPKTWKTANYNLYEGTQSVFAISTTTDIPILIKILSQVRRLKKEHEDIVKEFGLSENTPCMLWGYNANLWIEDVEYKLKSLTNAKAIADITGAKTRLETFLSEDDRLIKTLAEIEKILK